MPEFSGQFRNNFHHPSGNGVPRAKALALPVCARQIEALHGQASLRPWHPITIILNYISNNNAGLDILKNFGKKGVTS
jgi:hypothetical protein